MGANQGRPSDGKRKSKKNKGVKEADLHDGGKGAIRRPSASPPAVVSRATSGDAATRAAPLEHAVPAKLAAAVAPAAAPALQHQGPHDDDAHPFHAPLDHVREEERPLQELCAATHFSMATLRKLQIVFTDIAESAVADGFVDGNELTDAMGLKSSCLLARTICRVFDITQKKSIDFAQWVKTISALCPEASLEDKIHFSFSLYDLNGDGFVDVEELQAMLEAAVKDENVLNLSDAEVAEWCAHTLSQVDRDGDGRVDYEEYRSMVSASTKFLESFTLDIQEICNSFKFTSRKSAEKLTAEEQDQRLNWFRARQRQHSQSGNSSHPEDSSNSEQHNKSSGKAPGASATAGNSGGAPVVAPAPAVAKLKSNSREGGGHGSATLKTGSGSYKPIMVAAPAPASSAVSMPAPPAAAAGASSSSGTRGSAGGSNSSRGDSNSSAGSSPPHSNPGSQHEQAAQAAHHTGKGMHVTLGPLQETDGDAAGAPIASSPSAAPSTPNSSYPTFHDAEPSPLPAASVFTESSPDNAQSLSGVEAAAQAAAASAAAAVHDSATQSVTISSVSFTVAASASSLREGEGSAAPHGSAARRGSTGATTGPDVAAAAAAAASDAALPPSLMRRQQSAPVSTGPHSAHYVASRLPLSVLKQASIGTLAHSDDEVEEMDSPLVLGKSPSPQQ